MAQEDDRRQAGTRLKPARLSREWLETQEAPAGKYPTGAGIAGEK
jgi:hypothetical protein